MTDDHTTTLAAARDLSRWADEAEDHGPACRCGDCCAALMGPEDWR